MSIRENGRKSNISSEFSPYYLYSVSVSVSSCKGQLSAFELIYQNSYGMFAKLFHGKHICSDQKGAISNYIWVSKRIITSLEKRFENYLDVFQKHKISWKDTCPICYIFSTNNPEVTQNALWQEEIVTCRCGLYEKALLSIP